MCVSLWEVKQSVMNEFILTFLQQVINALVQHVYIPWWEWYKILLNIFTDKACHKIFNNKII